MIPGFVFKFAAKPDDSQAIRSEKAAIFLVAASCSIAGVVWATTYWFIFGWGLTSFLPILFVIIVGSSLVVGHVTKNHRTTIYAQILSITLFPAFIQWSIGGIFDSGFVLAWASLGPLGALMFLSPRKSAPWFAVYFASLLITVVFDDFFAERALEVGDNTKRIFFAMNLSVSSLVVFLFAGYFVTETLKERRRANQLLLNVLPAQIAEALKLTDETIADHHDSVSVLFADVVGSTPLFAEMEPTEVVDWLNEAFSLLDDVVERHGLEKLRTMGDNFMVGSGVPAARDDHAHALTDCALDMILAIDALPARNDKRIRFRIGINSGPVVAGVIGKSKFHYDLWGDTVNVASRMESSGEVGRVHVAFNTYELIKNEFECLSRGTIPIKGKGEMPTWFITGRKTS